MEASKSVGGHSGWHVQHLLVKAADGTLVAAAPCYLKSHSRGEYVFDYGWAEAYAHAGGNYYPKLQVAVPFTPAAGRRLLVRPGAQADAVRRALANGLVELCRIDGASGVHLTFLTEPEYRFLANSDSCSARTSNSIGKIPATQPSTISLPRSPRANARPSAANAMTR